MKRIRNFVCCLLVVQPAYAQTVYLPEPSVILSVGGEAEMQYRDNLYRSPQDAEGDFIGVLRPSFKLRGDFQPYLLRMKGKAERGQYITETQNDYMDADLRAQIAHDKGYYLDSRLRYDHVEIGAFSDDPGAQADEPTAYRYAEAGAGWLYDSPAWIGKFELRSFLYNYDNTRRLDGAPYFSDDRDYAQHALTGRGGYKLWPQTAWYLQGTVNTRDYAHRIDTTLSEPHDSSGYELLTGLIWNTQEDPFSGDAGFGFLHQDFDFNGLADVTTPALHVLWQWQPSTVLRLRGDAVRELREAVQEATSSAVQSRLRLRGEYLLAPDWQLGGSLRYTQNDFQISPASGRPKRLDTIWDGGVFLHYLLSEAYFIGGEIYRIDRGSDDPEAMYHSNLFLLRFGVTY